MLNLYSGPDLTASDGVPPDVTLVGPGGVNIMGSLKLDPDNQGLHVREDGHSPPGGRLPAALETQEEIQDLNTGYPLDGTGGRQHVGQQLRDELQRLRPYRAGGQPARLRPGAEPARHHPGRHRHRPADHDQR